MTTRMPVISICDFGLMKLGRFADFRAQLKILEIRLVLTRSEAYMREKPKLTCNKIKTVSFCAADNFH